MKSKKSVAHEVGLLDDLKDMNFVLGYLNSILDGLSADESLEPFLLALNRVAKAHGIQKLATESKRTSLGFSQDGLSKDYLKINGQWKDHVLTSLINTQWKEEG